MKVLWKSDAEVVRRELLRVVEGTVQELQFLSADLKVEFGESIVTKKLGGSDPALYSYRDRVGSLCDTLLNVSFTIAQAVGLDDREFRQAVDQRIPSLSIYNGEYDRWSAPGDDTGPYCAPTLERGRKRWWAPNE